MIRFLAATHTATHDSRYLPAFLVYLVVWLALGLASWLHVRTKTTAAERKKIADRYVIALGVFVAFACCFFLIFLAHQPLGVPIALAVSLFMIYRVRRDYRYCESCLRRHRPSGPFSRCPYCDHCAKPPSSDAA